MNKFTTLSDAVSTIADGCTVAITGSGGGLLEPDALMAAIEQRFLTTGAPRDLTLVHAQGIGDGDRRGLNRLAHEGLVKRVIGAHWSWSPRMQTLALENRIEAYALPGGVIQHLLRETAAGRPGLITPVGVGTTVDPRLQGGRLNARTQESLCDVVTFDRKEFLHFKALRVDVALLRGSAADPRGNTSFEEEAAELDALVLAMAAHNARGKVFVQVADTVDWGSLPARRVRLPGALVDKVVKVPEQLQSHSDTRFDDISGTRRSEASGNAKTQKSAQRSPERLIVGLRAAEELRAGAVVGFGFGMPDEVAAVAAADGRLDECYQTLDHGHYGGYPLKGNLFGYVRSGDALIDSPSQFDFYSGGGVEIAFLGFGELDASGNVNVSRLGGKIIGPGGFMEIAQGAQKVVFCGSFESKGLQLSITDAGLSIRQPGSVQKVVKRVAEITFSGERARASGQKVIYVTERAVFHLDDRGIALEELAPGIDLQRDLIDRMGFMPIMRPAGPKRMRAPGAW